MPRNPLVGTWKMLSWTREVLATGAKSDAFSAHPIGYINYSPEGRVIVIVVKEDRKAPVGPVPTDQEKIELFNSLLSYAGTYTVDDEKVVHHIDASWNEAWTGTSQTRFYRLDGNRITLTSVPARCPIDGQETVYTIVFEKLDTRD